MYIFKTNLGEQRENILFTVMSESPVAWWYWDLDEVNWIILYMLNGNHGRILFLQVRVSFNRN